VHGVRRPIGGEHAPERVADHAASRGQGSFAHDVFPRLRAMHVALHQLQLRQAPDQGAEGSDRDEHEPAIALTKLADIRALD
jgi:hypothetical protein